MQISGQAGQKGFTLVEILIALAILAVVVASTFIIFRSSSESWQKGETRSERYHNARIAMGRMRAEISQAVLSEDILSRFIGEKEKVSFVSFASTASGIFELVEIGYWLDEKNRFLMRDEDIDPDFEFSTQDNRDILAENVSLLEFSYYDGLVWKDNWDSDVVEEDSVEVQKVLPKAVSIKINVEDKRGKESESFEILTRLKTS